MTSIRILASLNRLKSVDITFFVMCAVIIVLIVAVYFLIPVFNKKFYQEQRNNLHKREAAFKTNVHTESAPTEQAREADADQSAEPENVKKDD